jgi:hypothetical protein
MSSAFQRFHQELQRISSVVSVCQFSFDLTRSEMKRRDQSEEINPHKPVTVGEAGGAEIARNAFHLNSKLKSQVPRYIRETVFVRLISSFEVFLVDVIREVMLQRPDLFRKGGTIEITHAEALSVADAAYIKNKVINKETRALHQKGFKEVQKYYDKNLSIKFAEISSSISQLDEFHDRRHLLVHRLGAADAAYRHKHGYAYKLRLSIDNDYFENAVAELRSFSLALQQKVLALTAAQSGSSELSPTPQIDLEIEVTTADGEALIQPSFVFLVKHPRLGEYSVALSDYIVLSRDSDDGSFRRVIIEGDYDVLETYLKQIKKASKKGALNVLAVKPNLHFNDATKGRRRGRSPEPET